MQRRCLACTALEATLMHSLQDANDRGWFRTEPSRAKGKPDMGIILPTALEMAQGLSYLHSQGVLHGDLSPGNVLLSDKPDAPHGFTVKVSCRDFCFRLEQGLYR